MGASPLERRHRLVIELLGPFLRTMALLAILTEIALVFIVLGVAVVAAALAELVLAVHVARNARNRRVFALQGELRVIEVFATRRVEMQRGGVALRAILSELPFVFVFVTVHTVELVGAVDAPSMAALAVVLELGLRVKAR